MIYNFQLGYMELQRSMPPNSTSLGHVCFFVMVLAVWQCARSTGLNEKYQII